MTLALAVAALVAAGAFLVSRRGVVRLVLGFLLMFNVVVPRLLNLKQLLEYFLRHRRDVVTRRTIFQLRKARDRAKVDGRTTEIQRLIGRSLRAVVDMSEVGEFTLTVDCDVFEADGGTVKANRVVGGGVTLVTETTLPGVFTCDKALNEPRYAGLKGIMAAKKKPVDQADLAADPDNDFARGGLETIEQRRVRNGG